MQDDYEIDSEVHCCKCGHSPLHNRDCTNWCEDGGYYQTFDPDNNFQNRGSNTYYAYERYGSVVRVEDIQHDIVYHQSWSALMPVVEKIIKLKYPDGEDIFLRTFGMLDEKGNLMVRFNRSQLFHDKSLIKATWFAVVDFIEYFNEEIKAEDISVSRPMI